jgi:hypothetical protein
MLVNTDGLVLIGQGSEWFWSMLQFVIVAVTLLGIYYQLRISQSANAFAQLGGLVDEWQGEWLVRKRIGVLVALRDGAAPADVPDAAAAAIANFWEKVGALVRAGHIDRSLVVEGFVGAQDWWGILAPWVLKVRTEDANPSFWEHFEWLAGTMVRLHPEAAFDQQSFDRRLKERITANEADLRDLEAMRRVIVAPQAPTE